MSPIISIYSAPPAWPAFLRGDNTAVKQAATADNNRAETSPKSDPTLCCAVCLHRITSVVESVQKLGQHEHHCTNPHGCQFLIGCFAAAPGCENTGDWVSEYSWFPGYQWRYALCSACRIHLGWQFRSAQEDFHGLIKARLISYKALH